MRIAVTGAGGFVMGHMVRRLLDEGHEVIASDVKPIEQWWQLHPEATNQFGKDLTDWRNAMSLADGCDEVLHGACPMGGIGWITDQLYGCARSAMLTTHMLDAAIAHRVKRFTLTSSACAYGVQHQDHPDVSALTEDMARPLNGEPGYGMSKGFEELLCEWAAHDTPMQVRVARFHNIYGPHGSWVGGKEKAPAALCRKVAEADIYGYPHVDVWGDGSAKRSYCWIGDCIKATRRLMESDYDQPVNIGSAESVTVDELLSLVEDAAGVTLERRYDPSAPQGVRGRNSDNTLCRQVIGYEPRTPLAEGIAVLYPWVYEQVKEKANGRHAT
jgi:GDP-D-mannose 3', 5'-epimerase